jgi:hypothetical protein
MTMKVNRRKKAMRMTMIDKLQETIIFLIDF